MIRPTLILIAVALLPLAPASAQTEKKASTMEATVACFAPPQGTRLCATYRVAIVNKGAEPVDGIFEIHRPSPAATVRRDVRLAPGGTDRFFLYIESSADGNETPAHQVEALLKNSEGKVLDHPRISPVAEVNPSYIMLSRSGARPLAAIGAHSVASVNPEDLPDRWWGLVGLSGMILNDVPLTAFSERQLAAIREWVIGGGVLIVSPGADRTWLDHPLLKELVPVEIEEVHETSAMPLLEARYGAFDPSSPFLYYRTKGGKPPADFHLPPVFHHGMGHAVFIPFDLGRRPFTRWEGNEFFFARMIGGIVTDEENARRGSNQPKHDISDEPLRMEKRGRISVDRPDPFRPMINRLLEPSHELPSIARRPTVVHIGIILFCYCLLIGANYFFLKRRGLSSLNIVTIPVISIVVFFLVIGVGYAIKGLTLRTRTFTVIEPINGSAYALEATTLTMNAPFATAMNASFPASMFHRQQRRDVYDPRRSATANMAITQDADRSTVRAPHPGQWQDIHLRTVALRPFKGEIRYTISEGRIAIENRTPYTVRRALFCAPRDGDGNYNGIFAEIPVIPPDGKTAVTGEILSIYDLERSRRTDELVRLLLFDTNRYAENDRQRTMLVCLLEGYPSEIAIDGSPVAGGGDDATILIIRGEP